jgi:predicted permease
MAILRRIGNLFRHSQVDREIDDELQAHIALRTDDNLSAGMSAADARHDALLRFGNRAATKEHVAAADAALELKGFGQDLRYALRQFHKSPGFAATAVLTLAVAIGANAVVFSVLNALVLRPLDLPEGHRLFTVEINGDSLNSYPDYRDLRDRNRSFDGVALYTFESVGIDTGGKPEQVYVYEASGNYFDVLGVQPYLGRFFHSSDEHGMDAYPYAILSYEYWRNQFHGDAAIVGRTIQLNRQSFTVMGVAPPRFRGSEVFFSPSLWVPIVDQAQIEGQYSLNDRGNRSFWMIGRLKTGMTAGQAQTDLNTIAAYMKKTYPRDDDGVSFALVRPGLAGNMLGGPVRAFVGGLMILAGLILLAACANLGSLFAARAADRSREIALRVALGSTRSRILRQLLTEAMLIALAGGVAGIAGSVALLRTLSLWQPLPHIPINVPVNPDLRTYAVALALALASGILFGLAPVRQVFGAAPWEVVKTGVRATAGRRWFSLRDVLLMIQVAACAVLMTSSLVAVRGLARSMHSDFGFSPENAIVTSNDLNMAGYAGDRVPAMQKRMLDAAAALPGVTAAGIIDEIPLGFGWSESPVFGGDASDFRPSSSAAQVLQYGVSPGYFQAAGTALLAGRGFTWADDKNAPRVAVVNREFARRVFGSVEHAIGGHFRLDAKTRFVVIGVVEDGKYKTLTEDARLAFFQPLLQSPSSETWLVVRSSGDSQHVAEALQQALRGLDPTLPFTVLAWPQQLDSALFAARAATVSLGVLGLLGAMLAMTGIFGMASYSVGRRLKEMGIRMALGAGYGQVLRAALGSAFRLLAIGSAAGLLLGMAGGKVLSFIVYQATPQDPVVLAGTVAAMLLVGLVAAWAPARRALSVDPSKLMHEE